MTARVRLLSMFIITGVVVFVTVLFRSGTDQQVTVSQSAGSSEAINETLPSESTVGQLVSPIDSIELAGTSMFGLGYSHSCALIVDGIVICWGNNAREQGILGTGRVDFDVADSPLTVSGIGDAVAVSAGFNHTCVLRRDTTVACWGVRLNNGSDSDSPVPIAIAGLSEVTAIAAGPAHTCAVKQSGNVYCWGANDRGQLGNGATEPSFVPVEVSGLSDIVAIDSGDPGSGQSSSSCAVHRSGKVSCWGSNASGLLGNGLTSDSATPVEVVGLSDARAISIGSSFTCALGTAGEVSCWGENLYGLGDGQTTQSATPVDVVGLPKMRTVSAGGGHICAVGEDDSLWCWGANTNGQLGDGTNTNSPSPRLIFEPRSITAATAGPGHTCAATRRGEILCWGYNRNWQVSGETNEENILSPFKIEP